MRSLALRGFRRKHQLLRSLELTSHSSKQGTGAFSAPIPSLCSSTGRFVGKVAIECEMPGGDADLALPTCLASVDT
jgi:hypothetical protein